MKSSVFQIVVLSLFGALAVAGVGVFAFFVGTTQTQTIGQVEIWGTFDDVAIGAALRDLSDTDSRFKQMTYVEKNPETYSQELTEALAAGKGPDVFVMPHDDAFRDAGRVVMVPFESLPVDQFKNTFVEAANPFLTPEGIVAIPLLVDPLVLYWNRDMLSTAGFAKAPEFWNELYDMTSKITKRDQANSVERATIAFGEYQNVSHAKEIVSLLILQAGGEITTPAGEKLAPALGARGGAAQQAVQSALRFYSEFANPSNSFYTWNRAQKDSRAAFTGGALALYIGPASEEPRLRLTNPNLNMAVASIPQIKTREFSLDVATVYGLVVPRTSDNLEGAMTAVYLLAGSKPSQTISVALGIPSARRDVLSQPATGLDDLFNKQAIISKTWIDPHPQKTDEIFRAMIESITSGSSKLAEAVQRAEEALGTLLDEQQQQ